MTNLQMVEKQVDRLDDRLQVVEVWKTIQGEGPYVGERAVFIRLAGCNLKCTLCDTDYTSVRDVSLVETLILRVNTLCPNGLVVITGGEPFRQNLSSLVYELIYQNYKVQIETNGTLAPLGYLGGGGTNATIVCSPKTPIIDGRVDKMVGYFKYVMEAMAVDRDDGLPTSVLGMNIRPYRPQANFPKERIFVNPVDCGEEFQNKANLAACVESCMKYGYRLGVQLHKIIGMP